MNILKQVATVAADTIYDGVLQAVRDAVTEAVTEAVKPYADAAVHALGDTARRTAHAANTWYVTHTDEDTVDRVVKMC